MLEKIKLIKQETENIQIKTAAELESFRLKYLSRKGIVSNLVDAFRELPAEKKKEIGKPLNELKAFLERLLAENTELFEKQGEGSMDFDDSLPVSAVDIGARHPISIV